jgi:antitoxin Phd
MPVLSGWWRLNGGVVDIKRAAAHRHLREYKVLYNISSMLYNGCMATMAVSEAREKLSEAVETARTEAVVLERYGRPAAVLLSPERYEELMDALEASEDVVAFDAAMAEDGDNIPWEQVKVDLGWT